MTNADALATLFKFNIGDSIEIHSPLNGVIVLVSVRSRQVYHDRKGIHRTYTLFDGTVCVNFPAEVIEPLIKDDHVT